MSRIWFPAVLVGMAAVQTFGMDLARREVSPEPEMTASCDTVIY